MHGIPVTPEELVVRRLGPPRFPSPLALPEGDDGEGGSFVADGTRVRLDLEIKAEIGPGDGPEVEPVAFEKAGPRRQIYFDPAATTAALVTCGGLCPGTNNVIRSIFYELHYRYGVGRVLGVRYGFAGLNPASALAPIEMSAEFVKEIHAFGGTFLGSSRGHQDAGVMVEYLAGELGVDLLFCVGGDGTQRGTHSIAEEVARRGLSIAVVGVPKTIDNDIPFVYRSFGFFSALEKAREVIQGAHVEALGARNGVGLVQLMGRHAGFIAAGATLASQEVNFTLVPEVPFELEGEGGLLAALERRLAERGHAVVVVAEGAGQHLFAAAECELDASGNSKNLDVGALCRQRIAEHFARRGLPVSLKYFEPSYLIRSVPANTGDSLLCDSLARHAVHAAMAGRTDVLVGYWHNVFIHVPLPAVNRRKKRLAPTSGIWTAVLSATGQPARFGPPAHG